MSLNFRDFDCLGLEFEEMNLPPDEDARGFDSDEEADELISLKSGDGSNSGGASLEHSPKRSHAEMMRELAWERRRLAEQQKWERSGRISRSNSDCCSHHKEDELEMNRFSSRSLTEEDFEELRGCIDLGFRFVSEDPQLCNTFPALEVCYAVNRQLQELHSDSSSEGSSSPCPWRISSPGDDLSEVKEKLKHWARAVACISRQSC